MFRMYLEIKLLLTLISTVLFKRFLCSIRVHQHKEENLPSTLLN